MKNYSHLRTIIKDAINAGFIGSVEELTCINCEALFYCPYAMDTYNTNGDCLAEK